MSTTYDQLLKERNKLSDDLLILKNKMLKRLVELKHEKCLHYEDALVQINAPLALEQVSLKAQVHLLEELLNRPKSKFPLTKNYKS